MDFFKSILSDDPDPQSPPKSPQSNDQPSSSTPNSAAAAWSFGGLIKTLATQSESVIEIYRRDLKEFGSGLQKETAVLRDVAGRLPAEIDGVLKSTAEIISHKTDSLLSHPPPSDPNPDANPSSRKYSRFESQLQAIESDLNTYCSEPEDSEDFENWKLGFVLEKKREKNDTIDGIFKKVVPDTVDDKTFWFRYYYKVHKLKQQEKLRANLVNRAISVDLDEELSWDVEDEEEEDDEENKEIKENAKNEIMVSEIDEKGEKETNVEKGVDIIDTPKKEDNVEIKTIKIDNKGENESNLDKGIDTSEVSNKDEALNGKIVEVDTSGKDSDLSIVSTQPSLPEEDMGWDEIEDVESGDERREKVAGSPNRADLQKRLSAAEEDEDLSWDIEDDDEPVAKSGAK